MELQGLCITLGSTHLELDISHIRSSSFLWEMTYIPRDLGRYNTSIHQSIKQYSSESSPIYCAIELATRIGETII